MATAPDVKTEKLPNTYSRKGRWYFKCSEAHVPLAGEPFDDDFHAHYYSLCELFGVGLRREDPRSVYFLGWDDGPIKIGMSGTEHSRRTTLQTACPYELKVWAVTTGGLRVEHEYHKRFRQWHMRGEWFERCPEIESEIERLSQ